MFADHSNLTHRKPLHNNNARGSLSVTSNILKLVSQRSKHGFGQKENRNLVRDQVGAVEADAELTNHANGTSRGHRFHECLGPWLCDGAQVVDQFVLCHANARILDGQGGVRLVGDDLDEEVGLGLQNDDNTDALQNDDDTVALGLQNAWTFTNA